MHCLILAGLLSAPLHAEPATTAAATRNPAAIMTEVYREAVKTAGSNWLDPERRPKRLSKSLLALWAKADAKKPPDGDEGPIDFDITADTNALTLESFVVRVPQRSAATETVDVALTYQKPYDLPEGPAIVNYDFVREDDRWVIDNRRSRRAPTWSVRDLLSLWLKED